MDVPSGSGQINVVHRLNAARHSPSLSASDQEMDEFAPLRLAFLLSVTFVFVAIYVVSKFWRTPIKTRPHKNPQDEAWGALLDEVSEDELQFTA